jgi:hypothetical protein
MFHYLNEIIISSLYLLLSESSCSNALSTVVWWKPNAISFDLTLGPRTKDALMGCTALNWHTAYQYVNAEYYITSY